MTMRIMILRNLKDTKVLMTGLSPHLRTRAKLVPADAKEEKRKMLYSSFDPIVSVYARSDKFIGFSEKYI